MVTMLRTVQGSPDGLRTFWYEKGQTYGPETQPRTSPRLEEIFVKAGLGERPDSGQRKQQDSAPEKQVQDDDRETKVVDPREGDKRDRTQSYEAMLQGCKVGEVLDLVRGGDVPAAVALEYERANANRSTLIQSLEGLVLEE